MGFAAPAAEFLDRGQLAAGVLLGRQARHSKRGLVARVPRKKVCGFELEPFQHAFQVFGASSRHGN